MASKYLIRASEQPGYSPANHTGTLNRRLISKDTVGAKNIEMLLGTLEGGGAALPHAHPGIEQVCYLLEGTATAAVGGESFDMVPGDCCYFPPDIEHVFTVTSPTPVKLLVIYSPPYEENPDRVIRRSGTHA